MPMQLIESFDIKLATPDCFPGADWYRVFVDLHNDITEVLPYLNAEFKGADYNHNAKILLWNNDVKKYAFRPREIVVAPIENMEEAQRLVNNIVCTVNNIWIRRDEIKPKFEGKKSLPNVFDIYKLLPRTNCKECGFLSCMAFAAVLRSDSTKLSLCPYISEQDYFNLEKQGQV
jgi:ArsR family metal-binding transcriptional regulator